MKTIQTTAQDRLAEDKERTLSFYAETFDDLKKLRVTSLQSAEECTRRWYADTIGPNVENVQNIHTQIGTLIHLLCENKLRLGFFGQQLLDGKALAATVKELFTLAPVKELQNFTEYATRLEAYADNLELLEVESEYKMPLPNIPIPVYGQVDAIFRHRETGNIVILDHKTNRRPEDAEVWKKKLQPQLYSAAIMEKYCTDSVTFIIGQVNQSKDIPFSYDASLISSVQKRCDRIWNDILVTKETSGRGKINKYCAFCKHKDSCATYEMQGNLLKMLGAGNGS